MAGRDTTGDPPIICTIGWPDGIDAHHVDPPPEKFAQTDTVPRLESARPPAVSASWTSPPVDEAGDGLRTEARQHHAWARGNRPVRDERLDRMESLAEIRHSQYTPRRVD